MRTKPKCLNIKTKQDNFENKTASMLMSNKLSGSFISVNSNVISVNDPTYEYREYRNRIWVYMNIFKEHIYDKDHPFNIIAKHFARVFGIHLQNSIREIHMLKNSNDADANREIGIITDDIICVLQKFIIKFQCALRLMYAGTINYHCFIEEKDEFINLVTSLLMNQGKLYEYLFELFEIALYDQIKALEAKFNDFKNIKPEDLGIHEKFCLNEKTQAFQKRLLEENKTNLKATPFEFANTYKYTLNLILGNTVLGKSRRKSMKRIRKQVHF
jgi:hypothetical protein